MAFHKNLEVSNNGHINYEFSKRKKLKKIKTMKS